jgi:hypothetical protein
MWEPASLRPGSSPAASRKVEPMQELRSLHVEAAIPRWKCSNSGRTVKAVDDCRAGQSRGVPEGAMRIMASDACSRRNEAGAVCDAAESCGMADADDALRGRDLGGTTHFFVWS